MVPITRLKTQCFLKGSTVHNRPYFFPPKVWGLFEVNACKQSRGGGIRALSMCTWTQVFIWNLEELLNTYAMSFWKNYKSTKDRKKQHVSKTMSVQRGDRGGDQKYPKIWSHGLWMKLNQPIVLKVDSLEIRTNFLVCQTRQIASPGSIGKC